MAFGFDKKIQVIQICILSVFKIGQRERAHSVIRMISNVSGQIVTRQLCLVTRKLRSRTQYQVAFKKSTRANNSLEKVYSQNIQTRKPNQRRTWDFRSAVIIYPISKFFQLKVAKTHHQHMTRKCMKRISITQTSQQQRCSKREIVNFFSSSSRTGL